MPSLTAPAAITWRELHFGRPLAPDAAIEALRRVATDPYQPVVTLEVRGSADGVRYLLGTQVAAMQRVSQAIGAVATALTAPRNPVMTARKVLVTNRRRPLTTDALPVSAAAILSALSLCKMGEELALQVTLGKRLSGLVVPSNASQPVSIGQVLIGATSGVMDAESRAALVKKVCEPGFAAIIRVGVIATTPDRRRDLALNLLGALRRLQAPNVSIYLAAAKPAHVEDAKLPLRWPLRLNVSEVAAVSAFPVGDSDLPGLSPLHPKPLPPPTRLPANPKNRLIVAEATAPGLASFGGQPLRLTLSQDALLRHLLVTGPTGVGKSVLLENLILQHVSQGLGAVVIEPKGDLVTALLAKIPKHRRDDVVILDPNAQHIVGLNPLDGDTSPELRADAVLSVFTQLFGDSLGVRSADVLHACLLTLAQWPGASLIHIQRLLTDAEFRRRLLTKTANDPALAPFWAWYESLPEATRAAVTAPLGNKLRTVLMKKAVRSVVEQASQAFDIRDVFRKQRILLVPLSVATLGNEGSALLGSLIVAAVWNAARERARVEPALRKPVMICPDEFQNYARLPDIEDALATSRSYGVGWVLAHQFEGQLPATVRDAVRANVRSRVAFQLAHDDAKTFAAAAVGQVHQRPEASDFTALPAFHVYASLMEDGQVQPYASGVTLPPQVAVCDGEALRRSSAEKYGRAVEDIEEEFTQGVGLAAGASADRATDLDSEASAARVPAAAGATGTRRKATESDTAAAITDFTLDSAGFAAPTVSGSFAAKASSSLVKNAQPLVADTARPAAGALAHANTAMFDPLAFPAGDEVSGRRTRRSTGRSSGRSSGHLNTPPGVCAGEGCENSFSGNASSPNIGDVPRGDGAHGVGGDQS